MMQMPNTEAIKNHQKMEKENILAQYHIDEVQKGMSVEEFQFKYPTSMYDTLSQKAVESFSADFSKSEDANDEELKTTLEGLEAVSVTLIKGEDPIDFYVRKKEVQEEGE